MIYSSDESVTEDFVSPINSLRFVVEELAGRGSWGEVFYATDTRTGRRGAIKIINPTPIAEEQKLRRGWDNKGVITRDVPSSGPYENVLHTELFHDDDGKEFVWMPSRVSHTLEDELLGLDNDRMSDNPANRRLGMKRIEELALGIANGLENVHQGLHIIHRDLKPKNVLIEESSFRPLIADFGSSTIIDGSKTKDCVGDICIKSYEIARNDSSGHVHSDIFSLGQVVGRMLIGSYLHQEVVSNAINPNKALAEISEGVAKASLEDYVSKAPKAFRKVLKKSLAYNPNDRYKSAEDLRDDLVKA
ncbi:hypothetical protein COU61_04480, partial [Candidatus Pacearchaeota archaeon CG10_big_fil_rev_8_21_14_0_10_35_13]